MHRLALIVLLATPLAAQQPTNTASEVAITIQTPDKRFRIDLASKSSGDPPRMVWRGDYQASVRARLDEHHLLLCREDTSHSMHALDLRTGETRHIVDAYGELAVTVYGEDLFFLKHRKEVGLALRAIPWRGGDERAVADEVLVGEIPLVVGHHAFGFDISYQHVWRFDLRDGTAKPFVTLPAKTVDVRLALSPTGKQLAISSCIYHQGNLQVVDFATGKLLREWSDLDVVKDRFIPTLPIRWNDADCITAVHDEHSPDAHSLDVLTTRSIKSGRTVAAPELPRRQFTLHNPERERWQLIGPGRDIIHEWTSLTIPNRLFLAPDRAAAVAKTTEDTAWQLLRRDAPATDLPRGQLWHCQWLAPAR